MDQEDKQNSRIDGSEHIDLVHLMRDHEEKDNQRFDEIKEELRKISAMLEPIHDIYAGSIFTFRGITGLLKLLAAVGAAVAAVIYLARLK